MAKSYEHLVVYDISDQRERTRVSKVLAGYGRRVQESVFECCLNRRLKEKLRHELEALSLGSGFILLYRIQTNSKRLVIGEPPPFIARGEEYAFIV